MLKTTKTSPEFSPHRVTIKRIHFSSPSRALVYLDRELTDGYIVVNKQRESSITVIIYCNSHQYELLKLSFVKDMGTEFIWKDRGGLI